MHTQVDSCLTVAASGTIQIILHYLVPDRHLYTSLALPTNSWPSISNYSQQYLYIVMSHLQSHLLLAIITPGNFQGLRRISCNTTMRELALNLSSIYNNLHFCLITVILVCGGAGSTFVSLLLAKKCNAC